MFDSCYDLKSVKLPGKLDRMGYLVFDWCMELETVIFPDTMTLKSLPIGTFADCWKLGSLYLPDSIKATEALAFANCLRLAEISAHKDLVRDFFDMYSNYSLEGNHNLDENGVPHITRYWHPEYQMWIENVDIPIYPSCYATFVYRDGGPTDPEPVIDTDALAALIAETEALDEAAYTAASWAVFESALSNAKFVLLNGTTQAEIDAATIALLSAAEGLELAPSVTLISATPSAFVTKLNGNQNDLTITVKELYSDGSSESITATIKINNNAAGIYNVGNYKVYVDTKGNTQIREIFIVK